MLLVIILICTLIFSFSIAHSAYAMFPRGKFTERSRMVIGYANGEAKRLNSNYIDTEHLLLGLILEGQGIAVRVLYDMGVDLEKLKTEIMGITKKSDTPSGNAKQSIDYTRAANQVIRYSMEEAQSLGYDHIGTEHILIGLIREKNGIAAKALSNFNITLEKVRGILKPVTSKPLSGKEKAHAAHSFTTTQVSDYADGSIDATKYIQNELNEVGKTGGEVFLPAGRYRLDGHLTIPPGVALSGTWTSPHHAQLHTGTVLLAYEGRGKEDAPPLISLSPGSTIRGLTIFYPEQNIDDVKPYPWAIQGRGMHNSVIDVTLVNPYKGIDIGSFHNELHYLRNVFGCPLKIGVYVNNCTDIGRIENVHFNPHYWSRDEGDGEPRPNMGKLIDYLLKEGEGFVFGRTDWEYVLNTFCYGYKVGYRFIATKEGVCNGNFLGIGADGTKNAIKVDQAAPYGILITNGEFVSMKADDPVEIIVGEENSGVIQLNNCAFWGPSNQIARIEGNGSVSFVQCNFVHWDHAKKNLPAIQANGGSLMVQGCKFHRGGKHIQLGKNQRSAVIFGNQTKGNIEIDNESQGDIQIGFNVAN